MPTVLTTQEVADMLRLSTRTVRELVNSGVLRCAKLNRRNWRFRRSFVEQFLERREAAK